MDKCCPEFTEVVDDGYDYRGSGTDHYKFSCNRCKASFNFWVRYGESYEAKKSAAQNSARSSCNLPIPRKKREIMEEENEVKSLQEKIKILRAELSKLEGIVGDSNEENSVCPEPWRNGTHEIYLRSNGSTYCRACGLELKGPR